MCYWIQLERNKIRDFPGGPVVKNLPAKAGDTGLIPDQGTKIPHVAGQLSLLTTTGEPMHCNQDLTPQDPEQPRNFTKNKRSSIYWKGDSKIIFVADCINILEKPKVIEKTSFQ